MADLKITLPIEKAETEDGRWVITGKAAGMGKDLQGQLLKEDAIRAMARRINEAPVPFKDWHAKNTILGEEIGYVTSAKVDEDFALDVEVELDKTHPTAQYLWGRLDKGKKYGMSVGGKSDSYKVEQQPDGQRVVAIYDVEIDEVSVTTQPIWTPSFGTVIRKAIDEAIAAESVIEGDTVSQTTPSAGTATESAAQATETTTTTSAPETVVEGATGTVDVQKAVVTDTARESRKLTKLVELHNQQQAILKELGLLADETPATGSVTETSTTVEKSDSSPDDERFIRLEKALSEAAKALEETNGQIEILKSQIPTTPIPSALTRVDEVAELRASLNAMSPSDRLRFGLAALHGEQGRI